MATWTSGPLLGPIQALQDRRGHSETLRNLLGPSDTIRKNSELFRNTKKTFIYISTSVLHQFLNLD
jgi:hypothetical protein